MSCMQQPLFRGPPGDPYWDYVVLLLHFEGVNGGIVMTDSSKYARAPLSVGQIVTTTIPGTFKVGSSAAYQPGGNVLQYSPTTDISFPNGTDFTIEFWVNTSQPVTSCAMIGRQSGASTNRWFLGITNQSGGIHNIPYRPAWFFNGSETASGDELFPLNTWTHYAVARAGIALRLFVNGQMVANVVDTNDYTDANNLGIFATGDQTVPCIAPSYIDELRITKGIARYTANFTPSIIPFLSY